MELELLPSDDEVTRVALTGRMDTAGVGEVEARFNAATVTRRKNTSLDLAQVTFIASMGIRMLVTAAKSLSRFDARLVLLNPQEIVAEYMADANLGELIPIVHSEAEALERFGG
jgi:anti-anti-sigma factor